MGMRRRQSVQVAGMAGVREELRELKALMLDLYYQKILPEGEYILEFSPPDGGDESVTIYHGSDRARPSRRLQAHRKEQDASTKFSICDSRPLCSFSDHSSDKAHGKRRPRSRRLNCQRTKCRRSSLE